jgi:hypothetical protein
MKFSKLILAVAATTTALTAFSASSQAASVTLTGRDGSTVTVDSTQDYLFEFVSSQGSFQSNFYVPPTSTPAITEKAPGFISVTPDFPGECEVCSFVSKITLDYFVLETVAANPGDVVPFLDFSNGSVSYGGAKFTGDAGFFTIAFNDRFSPDSDFNDYVVTAKAVPVPAIVPGIALAGAFLANKSLKRNKKDGNKSVA